MFDGIALESKGRYCSRRDSVIGLCCEHSKNVGLRVSSFEAINNIHKALFKSPDDNTKKVCFGSDATVVALAPYARDNHYTPVPLVASPSDKTETGEQLSIWIRDLLDEYNAHAFRRILHGWINTIASDGDSSFRKARHILCMTTALDADSELGRILRGLLGMNILTSPEGIVGTCDPKHVFKRMSGQSYRLN